MTAIEKAISELKKGRKDFANANAINILSGLTTTERDNIEQAFISGYAKACFDHDVQFLEIEAIPAASEYMDEKHPTT